MKAYLAALSSLAYWRREREANPWLGGLADMPACSLPGGYLRSRTRSIGDGAPGVELVGDLLQNELLGIPAPLEFLVRGAGLRRQSSLHRCRSWSDVVPSGSFVRVSDRLFVSSPEFCLMQLASTLSYGRLACLCFEACGAYVLSSRSVEGFLRAVPVTSPALLASFAERSAGLGGVRPFRRVIRRVLAGSASPMESVLAILLCFPRMLGGYGLPLPKMNYRVDVPCHAGSLADSPYYLCDLYWPSAHLAVEYDSDLSHAGSDRIASDAQRRNALESLGTTVLTVTKRRLYDEMAFDKTARQIMGHLGRRARDDASPRNEWGRRMELRREILPSRR